LKALGKINLCLEGLENFTARSFFTIFILFTTNSFNNSR